MSDYLTTFLFQTANFLVLVWLLGKLFFRPVREMLEKRRIALSALDLEARNRLAEAERIQAEAKDRIAGLTAELDQLRSHARTMATQQADTIRADAHAQIQREREEMVLQEEGLRQALRDGMTGSIAESARDMVSRLLQHIGGPDLDRALVQAVCGELQNLDGAGSIPARVTFARPMDESSLAALRQALGESAEGAEFLVSPDLGAGLRVVIGRGLIDASAAGLSAYAARSLAGNLSSVAALIPGPCDVEGGVNGPAVAAPGNIYPGQNAGAEGSEQASGGSRRTSFIRDRVPEVEGREHTDHVVLQENEDA